MSADNLLPSLTFAPMYLRDVPLVAAMERRNYEFSWSEAIFGDCLRADYLCQLARLDDEIVGYGILQHAADEAHILNLCIDGAHQRRGFARQLLEHLVQQALHHRAHIIFLEVRPSNPRAVELYHRAGFNEIGLRKGYYDSYNGREDALVMARSLTMQARRMGQH